MIASADAWGPFAADLEPGRAAGPPAGAAGHRAAALRAAWCAGRGGVARRRDAAGS